MCVDVRARQYVLWNIVIPGAFTRFKDAASELTNISVPGNRGNLDAGKGFDACKVMADASCPLKTKHYQNVCDVKCVRSCPTKSLGGKMTIHS